MDQRLQEGGHRPAKAFRDRLERGVADRAAQLAREVAGLGKERVEQARGGALDLFRLLVQQFQLLELRLFHCLGGLFLHIALQLGLRHQLVRALQFPVDAFLLDARQLDRQSDAHLKRRPDCLRFRHAAHLRHAERPARPPLERRLARLDANLGLPLESPAPALGVPLRLRIPALARPQRLLLRLQNPAKILLDGPGHFLVCRRAHGRQFRFRRLGLLQLQKEFVTGVVDLVDGGKFGFIRTLLELGGRAPGGGQILHALLLRRDLSFEGCDVPLRFPVRVQFRQRSRPYLRFRQRRERTLGLLELPRETF